MAPACLLKKKWLCLLPLLTICMSFSAPSTAQTSDVGQEPVKFYRIRVEFDTRAERAVIDIATAGQIYCGWLIDLRGEPDRHTVRHNRVVLTQSLNNTNKGEVVGITADFALSPDCATEPISIKLRESKKNSTTARVYHVSGKSTSFLGEIKKSGEISIDLTKATGVILHEVQMPVTNLNKMVWAFYYPYYHLNSWDHADLKDTPLMQYSSDDLEAISSHIDQAKNAGIDGFLVSWWGPQGYSDKNLRRILKIAAEKDFKIAIYLEIIKYPNNTVRPTDELSSHLEYILTEYSDESSYCMVFDRPLIAIWSSKSYPLDGWKQIFNRLEDNGLEATYLACGFSPKSLSVFDGYHTYIESRDANEFLPAREAAYYYPMYSSFGLFEDNVINTEPRIMCATVRPGNDDRNIPGRVGTLIERDGGDRYRFTWGKAIECDPDWIFITSWNEWWEHTYIEPSERYGEEYLKITREYADKWKGQ